MFDTTLPRVAVTLPAIAHVAAFGVPVKETLEVAAKLVALDAVAATTQVPVRLACLMPLQVTVKSPETLWSVAADEVKLEGARSTATVVEEPMGMSFWVSTTSEFLVS